MRSLPRMRSKKALSEVIASVLLIVVVIVAIGIIVMFVVPMVKENLSGSKSCFDLRDYFKIASDSCYAPDVVMRVKTNRLIAIQQVQMVTIPGSSTLIVERGMQELEVKGFVVSVKDASGESKSYRVSEGTVGGVQVYNRTIEEYQDEISILKAGESKKYLFDFPGSKISIAPLQKNNKVCDASSFEIEAC